MLEAHHWQTLELPKVLAKLARYTSFSASTELAQALEPSTFADVVAQRLAETREARLLLTTRSDLGFGGVHDVRPLAENALRGFTPAADRSAGDAQHVDRRARSAPLVDPTWKLNSPDWPRTPNGCSNRPA